MKPKMSKRHICLVTDEVMPFTRGGIGAFVRNTIDAYTKDFEFSILFSGPEVPDPERWSDRYPSANLYIVDRLQEADDADVSWESRHLRHRFLTKSLRVCRSLMRLSQEGIDFDVIEFLDWGAPGYYALQYKLCGIWSTRAVLAVRVHCTESVLRNFEFRYPDTLHSFIYDIERKALADADLVVTSLSPVADYYKNFYGFSEDWRARVIVEPPEVWVEHRSGSAFIPDTSTNIVFSSKFQEIKRPKVFLSGALLFLTRRNDYRGDVVFAAFKAADDALGEALSRLPKTLSSRVRIEPSLTENQRQKLISNSIVVFPNVFEAFCFAAYEASLSGAIVVLNAKNPAFGERSLWKEGINCFKFDGTISGLADTLETVFSTDAPRLSAVDVGTPEVPYWGTAKPPAAVDAPLLTSEISALTVYVLHRNHVNALDSTISALLLEYIGIQIVILDDASTDPDAVLALARIAESRSRNISVRTSRVCRGWGALLNEAIRTCRTEFTCIMPAGTIFTIGALGAFVEALARRTAFDVLLPTSALLLSAEAREPSYLFHPVGESLASGERENNYAAHAFVARTAILVEHPLSEVIANNFQWEYLRRLALAEHRMLIWPLADIIYFDDSIRRHQIHDAVELAINQDMICKLRQAGRGFGVSIDAWLPVSVSTPVIPSTIMPDPFASTAIIVADSEKRTGVLSQEDLQELEMRRRLARPRPRPSGLFDRAVTMVGLKRKLFRSHIDALVPSFVQDDTTIVTYGNQIVVEGWAFGSESGNYFTSSMTIEKDNVIYKPTSTSRYPRLDVSLTFEIPENIPVGFSVVFDSDRMEIGNYEIVLGYKKNGKIIRRSVVRSFSIV